jgi:hypothetical protein
VVRVRDPLHVRDVLGALAEGVREEQPEVDDARLQTMAFEQLGRALLGEERHLEDAGRAVVGERGPEAR